MALNVHLLGSILLLALFKFLKSNFEVGNSRTAILAMDPFFRNYIKAVYIGPPKYCLLLCSIN